MIWQILFFSIEIETLRLFRIRNVPVPEVIHVDKEYMVIEALKGDNIDSLMRMNGFDVNLWTQCISSILNLHRKALCLSQSFARNLLWVDDHIYFVDFEEKPLDFMTLQQAQVRDLFFLC